MPFEIPKYAIQPFLNLLDKENIANRVWMWGQYMDSFATPIFIEKGEVLFSKQNEMHNSGFDKHSSIIDAYKWRTELLADLFKDGFIIEYKVANRLVVNVTEHEYIIVHESIGRMQDWCWIDQLNTQHFFIYEPHRVLEWINLHINSK